MEKTNKSVPIYEATYDVNNSIHLQTAYRGRDKYLDSLSSRYSWDNKQLLQIIIKTGIQNLSLKNLSSSPFFGRECRRPGN
jgi:hypothetical protein